MYIHTYIHGTGRSNPFFQLMLPAQHANLYQFDAPWAAVACICIPASGVQSICPPCVTKDIPSLYNQHIPAVAANGIFYM